MDLEGLISSAKVGDLDSFNHLVLHFEGLVYNVAYRIMGDRASAEDATQDAFISAYKKIGSFRGGSFKAWLLRIVSNACYDEIRRRKRKPSVALEPNVGEDEDRYEGKWMKDKGESPEEFAQRSELGEAIQKCLNGMDQDFRLAVILVDVQGFGYEEASKTMGSAMGTVKSRLARGRKRLRECLAGMQELLPSKYRLQVDT
jgi:RNA polymerase sigma-70 factor (ECF subfamily)